jgi:sn-glycerol 3-phosphate transport system substrate-binding protein
MKWAVRAISVASVAALALLGGVADAQTRTEISLWHAQEGKSRAAIEELVQRFNQSQREVEVAAVYKGTYPEVIAAATAAYRHKEPPHLVQVYEVGTQSMIMSDAIVPVHRLMQQQKVSVDWADFLETITGYYSTDGNLNSMPFNVSTPILYYNKDIFRKAGLPDTPPVTWSDVEAASRKILAAGAAKCGFTTPSPSWTLLENTFAWHDQPFATNQNGYTGLDTKLLINSEFSLMHVGALVRWQKENIFVYGGPEGTRNSKFADGDCAMVLQSSGSIGEFNQSLKFDWGTGQLPHWGPPYPKANTILGGATLWVMRGHPPTDDKAVAQFLKFITDSPQQMWWTAATGYVPVTKSAIKGQEDDGFYKRNPEQWTAVSQLLNAKPTPNSRGLRLGNYVEVRNSTIEFALENIFTGKRTVKEGLDAAVNRGNAILRQFSVSHGAAPSGEI